MNIGKICCVVINVSAILRQMVEISKIVELVSFAKQGIITIVNLDGN